MNMEKGKLGWRERPLKASEALLISNGSTKCEIPNSNNTGKDEGDEVKCIVKALESNQCLCGFVRYVALFANASIVHFSSVVGLSLSLFRSSSVPFHTHLKWVFFDVAHITWIFRSYVFALNWYLTVLYWIALRCLFVVASSYCNLTIDRDFY